MNKKKRNFLISTILILLALIFTILVKVVDVKTIGVNETNIGFATLNQFVFKTTGVNMIWYHITDWLGLVPVFMAIVYSLLGLVQLIYIVVISLYIFFEKVIVNYRPILMNGFLEASYPSSHTLMAICLCGSSIIVNKKLFNNKITTFIDGLSVVIIFTTVIGRLISGVHWFTDIVGGILIASALLMCFYSVLEYLNE